MSGISYSPEFADVVSDGYVSNVISVGTTAIEACASGTRLVGREFLVIYNDSLVTIYHGPATVSASGVNKGIPILRGETVQISAGDLGVFLIAGTASNSVIVQEFA